MSLFASSEAWDKSRAEGSTLLILLAIADYADQEGVAYPSQQTLASKARIAERSVRRQIQKLRDLDELETWEWFDKNRRKRNCYRILLGDFRSFRGIVPEDIRLKATTLRFQIPTARRREVFERDGWRCVSCESRELLTTAHVVPVSEGGGSESENLQTLCRGCALAKSDRTDCPVEERSPVAAPDRTGVAAPARAGVLALEPSRDPELLRERPLAEAPKATLVDGRNLGFDELADVCGIDVRNRRRAAEIATALKEIRAYESVECRETGELFERHVAARILSRAAAYRRALPGATLTPTALAKWWHDVERQAAAVRREDHVSPEEMLRRAADLHREGL